MTYTHKVQGYMYVLLPLNGDRERDGSVPVLCTLHPAIHLKLLLSLASSRTLDPQTLRLHAQVLLRPRCCLVVSGDAYTKCLHSIVSRPADPVTGDCCNQAAAGVTVGDSVPRQPRRLSLVFVTKQTT